MDSLQLGNRFNFWYLMKTFKTLRKNISEETCGISIFNVDTALIAGNSIGVDWTKYSLDQFVKGMNVELEHADVTLGSPMLTAKIVLAHLKELPDYYDRLAKMEKSAK